MADDRNSETPQVSRSGRVVKKSAKVREMEDFDINELDVQGKGRKKSKTIDDFDEFDDKRVAPIKIPKISLNMQGGKKMSSPPINRQLFKNVYHQGSMKGKSGHSIYNDSSDASKESDSSSVSSETSSSASSSDNSDSEDPFPHDARYDRKNINSMQQDLQIHRNKVIVEPQQVTSYEPPASYMEQSSDMSSDDSEDAASDPALVIAEDSDESSYAARGKKGVVKRALPAKKDPNYAPRQANRRKPAAKASAAAKQKKAPGKGKALSAYQLWCNENRKKICAFSPNISFGNLGKKMGEAWQAVPEKEKMAWKRKAKRLALQNASNAISTGPAALGSPNKTANRGVALNLNEDFLKGLGEGTGTLGNAPIDVAAHLKLLGDSLTVIGQRLIEHEGQLAVSGIYSVLLDTLLCAIGPLLCLTSEITGLEKVPTETFHKTLDHIAYFMPGL